MWKVTWAHPEFGQVLASCSFDRTAAVWEEQGTIYRLRDFSSGADHHWSQYSALQIMKDLEGIWHLIQLCFVGYIM